MYIKEVIMVALSHRLALLSLHIFTLLLLHEVGGLLDAVLALLHRYLVTLGFLLLLQDQVALYAGDLLAGLHLDPPEEGLGDGVAVPGEDGAATGRGRHLPPEYRNRAHWPGGQRLR